MLSTKKSFDGLLYGLDLDTVQALHFADFGVQ